MHKASGKHIWTAKALWQPILQYFSPNKGILAYTYTVGDIYMYTRLIVAFMSSSCDIILLRVHWRKLPIAIVLRIHVYCASSCDIIIHIKEKGLNSRLLLYCRKVCQSYSPS